MDQNSLAKAWVSQKFGLLTGTKKRWMIVTREAIFLYKNTQAIMNKQKILLSDIKDTDEKIAKDQTIFQVFLSSQKYEFRSKCPEIFIIISDLITSLKTRSSTDSDQDLSEKHENIIKTQKLIQTFNGIKKTLLEREQFLLSINSLNYENQKNRVEDEFKRIDEQELDFISNLESLKNVFTQKDKILEAVANFQSHCYEKKQIWQGPTLMVNRIFPQQSSFVIGKHVDVSQVDTQEFVVQRTKITRALKWKYSGSKIDALSFTVCENIVLTGIGFSRPNRQSKFVRINKLLVLKGAATDGKNVYTHLEQPVIGYDPVNSVAKIELQPPLIIKKNSIHSVLILAEGDSTYKCVECTDRYFSGNCLWKFFNTKFVGVHQSNRSDSFTGPIAKFYFRSMQQLQGLI